MPIILLSALVLGSAPGVLVAPAPIGGPWSDLREHVGTIIAVFSFLVVVLGSVVAVLLKVLYKGVMTREQFYEMCSREREECGLRRDAQARERREDTLKEVQGLLDLISEGIGMRLDREEGTMGDLAQELKAIAADRERRWKELQRTLRFLCAGQMILARKAGIEPADFRRMINEQVEVFGFGAAADEK